MNQENKPMTLPIGEAIRHVRETRGLTSAELAKRAHISRPYLSKVENGHTAPGLENIVLLAAAMDLEPHKLVKLICKMVVPNSETIADSALSE
jgi:transcriptional regulator with XRE-family HTH domain